MAEGVYQNVGGVSSKRPLPLTKKDVPALVQAVGMSVIQDRFAHIEQQEALSLRRRNIVVFLICASLMLTITLLILNCYEYL